MNLIDVFALLAIIALTLLTFACQRSIRRKVMRADRMRRYLEVAIRAESRAPRQMTLRRTG
jgi:hypothetical protein